MVSWKLFHRINATVVDFWKFFHRPLDGLTASGDASGNSSTRAAVIVSPAFNGQPTQQTPAMAGVGAPSNWGMSAKYDFDNPSKWVTETDVPVLDEHAMTDQEGQELSYVDRAVLQEIADNNNRRVLETGDPAPLIVGHTSDAPNAAEKPVVGYAVNYKVKPYRRDPETGQVVYAIHADYKVRPKHKDVINDFPRRSVELWVSKKELDPIALLGGTTPERDLGVVIRNNRGSLKYVSLLGGTAPERDLGITLRYSRRDGGTLLRYAMEDCGMAGGNNSALGNVRKHKYEADPMGPPTDDDDGMGGDDEFGGEGGDTGSSDPMVGKVLASKEFKQALTGAIQEALQAVLGDEGGGDPMGQQPGGDDGMGLDGQADAMGGQGGMGGPGDGPGGGAGPMQGGMPGGVDDEARELHGEHPVQFGSGGFPGPMNTQIPTGTKGTRYSRNGERPMNGTRQHPEVVKMQRQVTQLAQSNQHLVLKLARAEAEQTVTALEQNDRIIFADRNREIELLTQLDEASRADFIENVIKKNYQRQQYDPAKPAYPGLARYAANPDQMAGSVEDYSPQSPREAQQFADLQTKRGMKIEEAVKFMRQHQQKRRA